MGQLAAIESGATLVDSDRKLTISARVRSLHQEVLQAEPALCAERATLVTRYFRRRRNRKKPVAIQRAEALTFLLCNKRARINAGELLVGNFTSHRVGGGLYPELHGVAMLEDLFLFDRRKVNRFSVTRRERLQLLTRVMPFWLTRFMVMRIRPLKEALRLIREALNPDFYLINESGGISHFVPNYKGLLALGTDGYRQRIAARRADIPDGSPEAELLDSLRIVCDGLDDFAGQYQREAKRQAAAETSPARRGELLAIAEICGRVPRRPANSFRDALQSLLFAQIAINLESLDNSVCPGRLDQVLWPYYQDDLAAGRLTPDTAFELLGCFAVKLCEILPLFSKRVTRFHGGLFNGQVVVVGGTDREGNDATNELSMLFVELMDQLRTRQPNYHARLHSESPAELRSRIAAALADGAVSPALYNDEVIVPTLRARGVSLADARDYATVGCVEPVAAGKSYFSTDAALVNLPLCLELALNQGRRFGSAKVIGERTPAADQCSSAGEVLELFRAQVRHTIKRLLRDLRLIEGANALFHPTPLTSLLIEGPLDTLRDVSSGGAVYNGSGVQGVGVVEVGDSLTALDSVVFSQRRATLSEVIDACGRNFDDNALHTRLLNAPKYGNDKPTADKFTAQVMTVFHEALEGEVNTRGGAYVPGFYSVTAHQAFGEVVGALPSGRVSGAPYSSGISPTNGMDRSGPTAALMSAASLPLHLAGNGVNFNLKLAPWTSGDDEGVRSVQGLIDGSFSAGCMQMQLNVLSPDVLLEARDHPERYPGLLVRVSGYSAYFNDLSPAMQQEVIDRTLHQDRR